MNDLSPVITFEYSDEMTTVTHDDTDTADRPIAVESLHLTWGRAEYLEEHQPTSATFQLFAFDSAARTTGALLALRQSIPIVISVGGYVIFRGYPREVQARRTTLGGRDLYVFTVTAADITTVLEHHRPMVTGGWMATGMRDAVQLITKRLYELPRFAESVTTLEVPDNAYSTAVQIGHSDWDNATLRTYLEKFYRTFGGRGWNYNAQRRAIVPQPLGPDVVLSHLAHYSIGLVIEADTEALRNDYDVVDLDGDTLEVDEIGFTIGPAMNLRQVDVQAYGHSQYDKIEESVTVYSGGSDAMTADTMLAPWSLSDTTYIDEYAAEVANTVRRVTQHPLPPRVTYEFDTLDTEVEKRYWLSTWDTGILGILKNSSVLQWLQSIPNDAAATVPPTTICVGGDLEYDGTRWRVSHNLIHVGQVGSDESPVTYDTLRSGSYGIGDYAEQTTWSDFSLLSPNNEFKEYA